MQEKPICSYGEKCLLSQIEADHDCQVCQLCRQGKPDEYAVHAVYEDGVSHFYRLADLSRPAPGTVLKHVGVYRLAGQPYYAVEVDAFQPAGLRITPHLPDQMIH